MNFFFLFIKEHASILGDLIYNQHNFTQTDNFDEKFSYKNYDLFGFILQNKKKNLSCRTLPIKSEGESTIAQNKKLHSQMSSS